MPDAMTPASTASGNLLELISRAVFTATSVSLLFAVDLVESDPTVVGWAVEAAASRRSAHDPKSYSK